MPAQQSRLEYGDIPVCTPAASPKHPAHDHLLSCSVTRSCIGFELDAPWGRPVGNPTLWQKPAYSKAVRSHGSVGGGAGPRRPEGEQTGVGYSGPRSARSREKTAGRGEAINLRLRFRFWRLLEGGISNRQAAQVGNALTQHQLAVLMKLVFNNVAVELFLNALSPLLEPFQIIGRPPVHQVSMRIKLASLIVKTMRHFMSDHRTHCAIVDGVIGVGIEERRLKNASWKHDLVHRRIVIGIHGGRRHFPLRAIHRLADLVQVAMEFK